MTISKKRGFPIVLSGPSGSGKTTLGNLLLDSDSQLLLSISSTTRKPRGNEEDGVDYNFITEDEFNSQIKAGSFIEYANVYGHYYGSSKSWTEEQLNIGRDLVFILDIQGGMNIKSIFPDAILIFITPQSMDELELRLRKRSEDSEEVISHRLVNAREEIESGLSNYDYVVINNRIDSALSDLVAIVRSERLKRKRVYLRDDILGKNDV